MEDGLTTAKSDAAPEYKADLPALKRMYEESQTLTKDGRLQQQKDGDYYDGYQLTPAEKRVLKARKQPDNIWNFVRLSVNGTLGVIKQGSTDPRAYPRNPQDEDSADVASKTLRYIADSSNFDALKIDVAKDYLVPGTCASIIEVDEDLKVTVQQIRWEEFFYDPRSRRQDFSDARFMGIAKWWWADDVAAEYPDAKTDVEACLDNGGLIFDETQEDRPTDAGTVGWADKRQKRLMVVEMYHRVGQAWKRCKFFASKVLEEGDSPYLDDKKRPSNPIEAQSCYVDRENNRSGIVRDMRGPADEINKRSSKLLFELTARQVQEISPGSGVGEADDVRKEASRPDGVIPPGWQVVPRQDVVAGQAELLQNAHQAMSRFSPNPAILGREGENQSGRANQVRQQAGMTEQAIIFGGIEEWELRCYRQMWNRARQYWTSPMWVRVTDEEGSPDFVGVNQPPSLKGPDGKPVMGEDGKPIQGQPMADPSVQPDEQGQVPQLVESGKPAFQMPDGSKVLGYENNLAELAVDITIDTVPDTANLQQEQFALLTELAKMYGPQEVPFEDMLEVSTMPNKRAIIEKRKARAEAASEQQQSPQAQLQMRGAVAEVAKLESEVDLNRAKTETELAKPALDAAKLEHQAETADLDAQFRGAEMQQADHQHETATAIRGAEMQQQDQQFEGQINSKERLAHMQAEQKAQQPPPGS